MTRGTRRYADGLSGHVAVVFAVALLQAATAGAESPRPGSRAEYAASVVGLHVTYQAWDEDRPWAKRQPQVRSASAVLVGENRLLTTALMIDHATLLQVDTALDTRRFEARVVRVDRSVNLALLAVDDPQGLTDLEPVRVAAETPTEGTLQTVRLRRGQLETAASRVLKFEVGRVWGARSYHAFLHMRTDLGGGGWSEPVFSGRGLVGVTVSQSDQQSRAIPAEILTKFLAGEGDEPGFPALGLFWQVHHDSAVARFLGQAGEPQGILVRRVLWGSTACGVLAERDVILEVDGEPIDSAGNFLHARFGRLRFEHIFAERFRPGDPVSLRVLRDGEERSVEVTARTYLTSRDLVPPDRPWPPPFLVAGGLVIRELDVPYLKTWNEWTKRAPRALLNRYYYRQSGQRPDLRRVVLITAVLPSSHNNGYHEMSDQIVGRVNGFAIGAIEDVADAFDHPIDGFHVIDLAPGSAAGRIVLDAATFREATEEIVREYGLPVASRPRAEPLPEGGPSCAVATARR